MTHTTDVRKQFEADGDGEPTGLFRYRWECSCGECGPWAEGSRKSGAHRRAAEDVRIDGLLHIAKVTR